MYQQTNLKTTSGWTGDDLQLSLLPPLVITPPAGPLLSPRSFTLVHFFFSSSSSSLSSLLLLSPPPLPLFPGQISLAPWGQMRRPSWPMCRVTTTRSRASRRWEMKRKRENYQTIAGYLPKVAAGEWQSCFANFQILTVYLWDYNRAPTMTITGRTIPGVKLL